MRKLYNLKTTILVSLLSVPTLINAQPVIDADTVITGLNQPIQLVNAGDGSNRLFVVQKEGVVLVYDQSYAPLGTFLTVTGIQTSGEQGLLSLAFHPEYGNAASPYFGHFYVYYNNSAGDLQLARYQVSGDPNVADPLSKDTILTIPHPTNTNHNGGTLQFGNDGYLYLSIGDGGGGGDVPNNAQNGEVLLGKLLRIDVSSGDTPPFYSIPADNPFVGLTDTLPEIYSFGLRNPFRWSIDQATGDVWIGDVGQGEWEEIHYRAGGTTSGVNYGWRCYEGNEPFNSTGCGPASNYVFPIFVYPNPTSGASAVTGGVVYRGPVTDLQGYYIASDFYSGTFYLINPDGGGGFAIDSQLAVMDGVANFGVAENGEVYAVSLNDGLIASLGVSSVLPTALNSFTAIEENGSVELTWQTSFEENLSAFGIEHSENGSSFMRVGSVQAQNIATGTTYQFNHTPPNSGRSYYRLKMEDIDGQFEYSNVVSVVLQTSKRNFVQPSVISNGILTAYLPGNFNSLEIIGMNGAIFYRENISGRTGRVDINIPSAVVTGPYLIVLRNASEILRQKVLVN